MKIGEILVILLAVVLKITLADTSDKILNFDISTSVHEKSFTNPPKTPTDETAPAETDSTSIVIIKSSSYRNPGVQQSSRHQPINYNIVPYIKRTAQPFQNSNGDVPTIPGNPDIDYPVYSKIPNTSFDCKQQEFPGYYADVEARCQVFHVCALNKKIDFLCPNGTIFSQETLACVWWNEFDCKSAPEFYANNANLYESSEKEQHDEQNSTGNKSTEPENVNGSTASEGAQSFNIKSTTPQISDNNQLSDPVSQIQLHEISTFLDRNNFKPLASSISNVPPVSSFENNCKPLQISTYNGPYTMGNTQYYNAKPSNTFSAATASISPLSFSNNFNHNIFPFSQTPQINLLGQSNSHYSSFFPIGLQGSNIINPSTFQCPSNCFSNFNNNLASTGSLNLNQGLHSIGLPNLNLGLPSIGLPNVDTKPPSIGLPNLNLGRPSIILPQLNIKPPSFSMPSINIKPPQFLIPQINLPNISIKTSQLPIFK